MTAPRLFHTYSSRLGSVPALACSLLAIFLISSQAQSAGEEVALSQGVMQYRWQSEGPQGPEGEVFLDLPLKKTRVIGEISGFVARVTVQQFFANSTDHPIEAIYKFPLPANAAVHESAIRVGDRLVLAEIKEKEAARKKYEKAKKKGKRASLLEQEWPNIFTQSVANIGPGEEIVVAISVTRRRSSPPFASWLAILVSIPWGSARRPTVT